jgi:hypothetical protein
MFYKCAKSGYNVVCNLAWNGKEKVLEVTLRVKAMGKELFKHPRHYMGGWFESYPLVQCASYLGGSLVTETAYSYAGAPGAAVALVAFTALAYFTDNNRPHRTAMQGALIAINPASALVTVPVVTCLSTQKKEHYPLLSVDTALSCTKAGVLFSTITKMGGIPGFLAGLGTSYIVLKVSAAIRNVQSVNRYDFFNAVILSPNAMIINNAAPPSVQPPEALHSYRRIHTFDLEYWGRLSHRYLCQLNERIKNRLPAVDAALKEQGFPRELVRLVIGYDDPEYFRLAIQKARLD